MQEEKPQIDHNALSRQLAVYGAEAQGKLMSMRVLIHGLTGVKYSNLFSLAPKSPRNSSSPVPKNSLFDQAIVSLEDADRNVYCNESQIGKCTRAEACLTQLKELNPTCTVSTTNDDSIEFMYFFISTQLQQLRMCRCLRQSQSRIPRQTQQSLQRP